MNKLKTVRKIQKPWGREVWFSQTDDYMGKLLYVMIDKQVSLHQHREKEESMYAMLGNLEIFTSDDGGKTMRHSQYLERGDVFHVLPGIIHSIKNVGDSIALLLEVSTPHPEDSIRLKDFYGREVSK